MDKLSGNPRTTERRGSIGDPRGDAAAPCALKHVPLWMLMLSFTAGAFAQSGAGLGSISGVVMDASGAAVPGAKVTIANDANGVRRTIAANDAGLFNAPALPPAQGYRVTVEFQGFSPFEQDNVDVQVG